MIKNNEYIWIVETAIIDPKVSDSFDLCWYPMKMCATRKEARDFVVKDNYYNGFNKIKTRIKKYCSCVC